MVKSGSVLIGKNGQLFRVLKEEQRRLWAGSKDLTDCIVTIGLVDGVPQETVILKKQIGYFKDITEELCLINDRFRESGGIADDSIIKVEIENRTLKIDLDKARTKLQELMASFSSAEIMLKEKEAIINEFDGSAADIRKTANGDNGVEDIRNAVKNRGCNVK